MKAIQPIKKFLGLVEMTFGLVYASLSLPEWQAVKITFFAPCNWHKMKIENVPSVHKAGLIRYMRVCDLGHKIKVMYDHDHVHVHYPG